MVVIYIVWQLAWYFYNSTATISED